MKNIIRFVALILVIALCMCGCNFIDNKHAVVEMTTKSGQAVLAQSYNGFNSTLTGQQQAITNSCRITLQDEEDVLYVHFYCEECAHDEECELTAPASKLFECDCSDKADNDKKAKEYFAVVVSKEPDSEAAETAG